jgi:hypothetical protein
MSMHEKKMEMVYGHNCQILVVKRIFPKRAITPIDRRADLGFKWNGRSGFIIGLRSKRE